VTTAAPSPQADRRQREKRYLIMMGIRVVAFVVALLVARGWVRIIAIALALVLPWIAVVVANAGPRVQPQQSPSLWSPHRRRLEQAPPEREHPPAA
jgi:Flp pilus assembly protein TadB